jgi:acetyl-CoA carboxylase biotin carboxyl carrier protein
MSQSVDDVRALLRDFRQSPWFDLHVKSADWCIFLAKPGGKANPMLAVDAGEAAVEAADLGDAISIGAPHLGLFSPHVDVGAQVAAGVSIGVLNVLDRATEVIAESAGIVEAVFFQEGDLVEYGEALVTIR